MSESPSTGAALLLATSRVSDEMADDRAEFRHQLPRPVQQLDRTAHATTGTDATEDGTLSLRSRKRESARR